MSSKERAEELYDFVGEYLDLCDKYDVIIDAPITGLLGVIDLENERNMGNGEYVEIRVAEIERELWKDIDLNTDKE
jgi:hypothetical protein